eukprot:SAG22_NODE_432_length_10559_cov_29.404225_9_plen_106_part_00
MLPPDTSVIHHTRPPTSADPGFRGDVPWWEALEIGFTLVYTTEMALKFTVLGGRRYWSLYRNRFDGVVTVSSLTAEIVILISDSSVRCLPRKWNLGHQLSRCLAS